MTRNKARLAMASMALLWLVATAGAQFEISPDHPDEAAAAITGQSGPKQQELQVKIDEQQKTLRELNTRIDQQAKVAESARETAVESASMEDSCYIFVEAYLREQKQREQLKKDLAPQISRAEQTLAALQAQQSVLSAQLEPKSQSVNSTNRRPAAARKKPVTATTASLQATR
jgi:septal ring factor EnvC (AmiA/AmiB activator)